MRRIYLLIIFLSSFIQYSSAQTETRMFNSIGLNLRTGEKTELRISQLYGLQMDSNRFESDDSSRLSFIQHSVGLRYRVTDDIRLSITSATSLKYKNDLSRDFGFRLGADVRHYLKMNRFALRNSLGFQYYFPGNSKYQQRLFYSWHLKYRIRDTKWKVTPYVSGRLYYFFGGEEIEHYDEEGLVIDTGIPSGFHRYRQFVGLSVRPHDIVQVSLYYMFQKEFNVGRRELSYLNVPKPSGSIQADFKNYHLIGIALTLRFKNYSRSKGNSLSPSDDYLDEDPN